MAPEKKDKSKKLNSPKGNKLEKLRKSSPGRGVKYYRLNKHRAKKRIKTKQLKRRSREFNFRLFKSIADFAHAFIDKFLS